ncbi:MAG TPA: hypothetical protein VLW06_04375 [Terriglobales bacterium]|nr:hypothetical protein [Terriglobales bacterium]
MVFTSLSRLMAYFRLVIWLRMPILGPSHAVAHLNIRGQNSPHYSPAGDGHDQKPPEHPHDDLAYQNRNRGFTNSAPDGFSLRS